VYSRILSTKIGIGPGINLSIEVKDEVNKAIELMGSHGAIIIDPVNITGIDNGQMWEDLWSLYLMTFPQDIATYLVQLTNTTMRSLTDLIEFNLNHTDEEFHPKFAPNQHVFEMSVNQTNRSNDDQERLLNQTREWGGQLGIDAT
jgi:amidase